MAHFAGFIAPCQEPPPPPPPPPPPVSSQLYWRHPSHKTACMKETMYRHSLTMHAVVCNQRYSTVSVHRSIKGVHSFLVSTMHIHQLYLKGTKSYTRTLLFCGAVCGIWLHSSVHYVIMRSLASIPFSWIREWTHHTLEVPAESISSIA